MKERESWNGKEFGGMECETEERRLNEWRCLYKRR